MEKWQLQQLQSLPLEAKVEKTKRKIREWYEHYEGQVFIAFSGGLDSTVLLHIARQEIPDIAAAYSDTGLEYPEVRNAVKAWDNIEWVKPDVPFTKVIEKHGWPVVSKMVSRFVRDLRKPPGIGEDTKNLRLTGYTSKGIHAPSHKMPKCWLFLVDAPFLISEKCCDETKKKPMKKYQKATGRIPITGERAEESQNREKDYLKVGCNAFDKKEPKSTPLGFWTSHDILAYIKLHNLPYPSVYGDIVEGPNGQLINTGVDRTGCMFCLLGIMEEQKKGPNRFEQMKVTHPKQYEYCLDKLGMRQVMDYIGARY